MKPERLAYLAACVKNASIYQSGSLELLNEVYACRNIIEKCGEKFREYEKIHLDKGNAATSMAQRNQRLEKADSNRELAEMCEKVLK